MACHLSRRERLSYVNSLQEQKGNLEKDKKDDRTYAHKKGAEKMLFKVEKNYLVLPVSSHAKTKNLAFYNSEGVCVLALDLKLDFEAPDYDTYIDVRRFKGESLDAIVNPVMKLSLRTKDRMPVCRFREALRPKYHFTAPEGFFEVPGAVLYSGGAYHLFYNFNPVSKESGNTHTGHAASRNLVDWDCCAPVLFPDKSGNASVYGAVLDEKNLLSAKTSEKIPAVLFYESSTSVGAHIAVSDDGCESFYKLTFIPPVECGGKPCVSYSKRWDKYVMVSAAAYGKCEVYTSKNLRDFEKCQELDFDAGENPCFFPIALSEKEEKWVLFGKDDKYIIGEFDGNSFNGDISQVHRFNYSGKSELCPVHFEVGSGRAIRAVIFDNSFTSTSDKYCGVMGFPQEMRIVKKDEGERICVSPVREIEKLYGKKVKKTATGKENSFELRGIAQDINISLSPLSSKSGRVEVFGIGIDIDFENGVVTCGKNTAPCISGADGKIDIRILTDTCGFEIYICGGESYMTICEIPDANLNLLHIRTDSEALLKLEAIRLRDMRRSDRRR